MNFKFQHSINQDEWKGSFVAHIKAVSNKEELFKELAEKLNFPDYFGYNWDALNDLLNDFWWISEKKIVIIHDDIIQLHPEELKIYLSLMSDAIENWQKEEEHTLIVTFPLEVKDCILNLLNA